MSIELVSWNLAGRSDLWSPVASESADVALLQEARRPTSDVGLEVVPARDVDEWRTDGWEQRAWRTAIARLSDTVALEPIPTGGVLAAEWDTLRVSRLGTVTAARVVVEGTPRFVVVSVYAPWERPLGRNEPIWADASAHRILSDLAPLVHDQHRLPVLVAGDWNILHGYGENGDEHWARRYATVFERAESMGLTFAGPQIDAGGRQADPWPDELPRASGNVPTYHTRSQGPAGAARQLDFVFVSRGLADRVRVRARNEVDDWGPSDHCRITIDVDL